MVPLLPLTPLNSELSSRIDQTQSHRSMVDISEINNAAKNDATKCWLSNCRTTGGRTGRGSRRTRGLIGDQGNGEIDEKGGQVGGQGNEVNNGVDRVPDFSTIIAQQLQNLLPTILAQVGNQESVQDMSGCGDDQKVKYTTGSFVGNALMWWNSQIQTRGRETAVGMAWHGKTLRL
ncbi:hypothetical protein Tco_1215798 [Tanacetum coccineum]